MATQRFFGRVIDKSTKAGQPDLRVEARACGRVADPLAVSWTDERGSFITEVSDADLEKVVGPGGADIFFRVSSDEDVLADTRGSLTWDARSTRRGTIEIDPAVSVVARADEKTYSVTGIVADASGEPIAGATVRVVVPFLTTTGTDQTIPGSVVTGGDGHYHVTYDGPSSALSRHGEIRVEVVMGGDVVASETVANPAPRTTIEFIVGGDDGQRYRGRSRYPSLRERVVAALPTGGSPLALKDVTEDQEGLLSNSTRVPLDAVRRLIASAKLAEAHGSVEEEAFFGLLERGLPETDHGIFAHKIPTLIGQLQAAADEGLIRRDVVADLTALKGGLETAALAVLRSPPPDKLNLGAVVDAVPGLDVEGVEANEFLKRVINNTAKPDAFWAAIAVDGAFSDIAKTNLRFAMDAVTITGGFDPVVVELLGRVASTELEPQARALAALTKEDWVGLLEGLTGDRLLPLDTPGEGEEAVENYAQQLADRVEARFRTEVIKHRVAATDPTLSGFFTANPTFDFQTTRVEKYLAENEGAASGTLADQLRAIERLTNITRSWADTEKLIDAGLSSATEIDELGLDKFLEKATEADIIGDRAREIFEAACWRRGASIAMRSMFAPELEPITTSVLPNRRDVLSGAALEDHPSLADWTKLFGTADQCACEHCRSVLGPASYLADLLQLLKKVPGGGSDTARTLLFERRPDLPLLALSCSNAETPLPYVDLVNEILEVVAADEEEWPSAPEPVGTTLSAAELAAEPEILYPTQRLAAYNALEAAVYPLSLPFHLGQEEARVYLAHLGVRRAEMIEALAPASGPDAGELTMERLETTGRHRDIIAGPPSAPPQPYEYWGMAEVDYPGHATRGLQIARVFLEKSGLSFEELRELLATDFADPAIAFEADPPCNLDELTIEGLIADEEPDTDAETRRQLLNRFLRLRRVLGWSITETDKAVAVYPSLNEAALASIAAVRELQRRTQLRPVEILAWFADMDRRGTWSPSLFEEVFLNKRVLAPSVDAFQEVLATPGGTTVTPVALGTVRSGLLAALRLNAQELALLTDDEAADASLGLPAIIDSTESVSLDSLSLLFRVVSFARSQRMSIRDLRLLIALGGANPLTGVAGPTADPQATLEFLDLIGRARSMPFTLDEAHFLLRSVTPKGSSLEPSADQVQAWRVELEDLVSKAAQAAPLEVEPDDSADDRMDAAATEIFGGTDNIRLLAHNPSALTPTPGAFVDNVLAPFIGEDDASDVKAILVDGFTGTIPVEDRPKREAYIAGLLERYIGMSRLVVGWMAQTFGVEDAVARRIVDGRILAFGEESAVRAFLPASEWPFAAGTESERDALLRRIHKVTFFARRLELDAAQLDALYPQDWATSFVALPTIDWNAVPVVRANAADDPSGFPAAAVAFGLLLRAADFARLRDQWAAGPESFLDVVTTAAGTFPGGSVLDKIVRGSGWARADVDALVTQLVLAEADFAGEQAFARLDRAMSTLKRLGVDAETAIEWVQVDATFSEWQAIARQVRLAAAAKHDDASWNEVSRPLRNALRERQRDALVSYLLAALGLKKPSELYERLLIDVEMDPCAMTSRLVLAHSSVQMFIQRIQLNLEPPLSPSDSLAQQVKWMKNYRVWEANRKVFLWPENWIEPALRGDKTPEFERLERTLLSQPLDAATAEDAYRTYLDELSDLSNLEIMAMHVERRSPGPVTNGNSGEVVHVFGRTRKNSTYFYRNRELGQWSPWQKVDAPIEGEHVMPFTFGGRLYLSWASIEDMDRAVTTKVSASDEPPKTPEQLEEEALLLMKQMRLREAIQLWRQAKALREQKDGVTPPKLEASVKLMVSELRNGVWTPALESESFRLGASPERPSLSFRTTTTAERVEWLLVHKLNEPLLKFAFLPGTSTHRLLATYNVLIDVTGAYASQVACRAVDPSTGDDEPFHVLGAEKTTAPRGTAEEGFGQKQHLSHYQAFAARKDGGSLALYLRENGEAGNMTTIIEDCGVRPRVVVDRGEEPALERRNLILQNDSRTFFLDLRNRVNQAGALMVMPTSSYSGLPAGDRVYRFEPFYHPYVNVFRHAIAARGLDGLLRPAEQTGAGIQATRVNIKSALDPVDASVDDPNNSFVEEVDFRHGSAYGVYNWELFFHVPFHIATQLSAEGRYEEAQRWLHYIFDPTDGTDGPEPRRFWKFKPFADNTDLEDIQGELNNSAMSVYAKQILEITTGDFDSDAAISLSREIERWRQDPFDPHIIARMRTVAYQKTVVMRYIENLLAWADSLFAQDSIESINEAAQLYVLAANILGPKPELLPEPTEPESKSYHQLDVQSAFDAFSNAIVATEPATPGPSDVVDAGCGAHPPPPNVIFGSAYFCVPPNEKLLGYWDTVADRLFKIRNCMNIEGTVRTLPLFQPPIDPALLVRAQAAGVDIGSVLFDINVAAPAYRYGVLFAKAVEMASFVSNLGGMLLSTLEKGDAEALANMRQRHDLVTQEAILETRRTQVREAQEMLRATERTQRLAQERFEYYSTREEVDDGEKTALDLRTTSQVLGAVGQGIRAQAGVASLVPDFEVGVNGFIPLSTVTFGGTQISRAMNAAADAHQAGAMILGMAGDVVGTLAGYRRRKDDWDHQARLATHEIVQAERQVEAARIRIAIAQSELAMVQKQIAQSREVESFLRRKFTNAQLYGWMRDETAKLYHQAYKVAFDLAKRAERAFRAECAIDTAYIIFGHWDGVKKGLLAGERLLLDLRRMDAAYLVENKRELELVKTVSLAEHDPDQLIELRDKGVASFSLKRDDYVRDFADHYLRRLKSVAVTIPCTVGPYQGVLGTLELLQAGTTRENGTEVESRAALESIVTSQAQQDSGMFELVFRDDRMLPFEGAGAHLPSSATGPQFKFTLSEGNRFSFDTIDDLVVEARYTARRLRAPETLTIDDRTLKRLVRVREEFPDEWAAYVAAPEGGLQIELARSAWRHTRAEDPEFATAVSAYTWGAEVAAVELTASEVPETVEPEVLVGTPAYMKWRWTPEVAISGDATTWKLVALTGTPEPEPSTTAFDDVWLVFEYTVAV